MIAFWPDGFDAKNAISRFPGHFVDIMATLVDITGADYPTEFNGQQIVPMQGMSLLPVLKGEKVERQTPLFWQWQQGKAVRDGKWKIVAHGNEAPWELYNMENDPTEIENLARTNSEIVEKLNQLFISWQEENGQWN
jgi:arylsulfatase